MHFLFSQELGPGVTVKIAKGIDAATRIREFGSDRKPMSHRESLGRIYAKATYIKYQNAVAEFSAVAATLDDWGHRRSAAEPERNETLMLLEAFIEGDSRVAGALLLRSAWTNDIVVDFLVVNHEVVEPRSTQVRGVGIMLAYASFAIGHVSGAPYAFVETASHTQTYWPKFFEKGLPFIRYDETSVAVQRAAGILEAGNWTLQIR